MTKLLNIFSRRGAVVLASLVNEGRQDQGWVPFIRTVHHSVSIGGVAVGRYSPCLTDFVE